MTQSLRQSERSSAPSSVTFGFQTPVRRNLSCARDRPPLFPATAALPFTVFFAFPCRAPACCSSCCTASEIPRSFISCSTTAAMAVCAASFSWR